MRSRNQLTLEELRRESCYPASRSLLVGAFWVLIVVCLLFIATGAVAVFQPHSPPPPDAVRTIPDFPLWVCLPIGVVGIFVTRAVYEYRQLQYDTADALVVLVGSAKRSEPKPGYIMPE